jgi:hypothetical protein
VTERPNRGLAGEAMSAMLESLSEQILATRFLTCRYIATEARCIFVRDPTAANVRFTSDSVAKVLLRC